MSRTAVVFLLGCLAGAGFQAYRNQVDPGVPGMTVLPDGGRYSGGLVDGLLQGNGVMSWPNGDRYQGEFRGGLYHGHGELSLRDGTVYAGTFAEGRFHGQGSYHQPGNGDYTGEFVDGVFTGQGSYVDEQGNQYVGGFVDWRPQGQGASTDGEGNRSVGEFADGVLHGDGEYIGSEGDHYRGNFQYGIFSGDGELVLGNGDRYEGEFEFGRFQGRGTMHYVEPVDGRSSVSGRWRNGKLVEADDTSLIADPKLIAETVLYNQQQLLQAEHQQLLDDDPDRIDMYFLGIAGDGSESVFRREIHYIRDYFDRQLGTGGRSTVLINDRQTIAETPLATNTSIRRSLRQVAARMDPEQDILFVYLSSHGSNDFDFSLKQPGMSLADLSAAELGRQLAELPVRWKVVMISACYSGGFIEQLADPNTLVMTSAAEDRSSFGCTDRAKFTWFGEAYFVDALPGAPSFAEAFEAARELIAEREQAGDFEASKPQIHAPQAVLDYLAQWRSQLPAAIQFSNNDSG